MTGPVLTATRAAVSEDRAPYRVSHRRRADRGSGALSLRQSEHAEQVALFQWIDCQAKARPDRYRGLELAYAIPNGGLRNKAIAGKLKAEGVRAGVSDIHVPVPRGDYHGLFIELKTARGRLSDEQRAWLLAMREHGHAAACCRGWDEARRVIERYFLGESIDAPM